MTSGLDLSAPPTMGGAGNGGGSGRWGGNGEDDLEQVSGLSLAVRDWQDPVWVWPRATRLAWSYRPLAPRTLMRPMVRPCHPDGSDSLTPVHCTGHRPLSRRTSLPPYDPPFRQ